jgi:hypothetical protein
MIVIRLCIMFYVTPEVEIDILCQSMDLFVNQKNSFGVLFVCFML